MAGYTRETKNLLTVVNGAGPWWKETYSPGKIVPVSGIYKCTVCDKEIASNKDDPFPPQSHHQLMCAELAGDFHLGDSRQLTDKSLLPFDLVS